MSKLLDPEILRYFFGSHFNVEVAMSSASNLPNRKRFELELRTAIEKGKPHVGLQFVGYEDIDTGFSMVAVMQASGLMSGVSFFAESKHRVFGGQTLVCVPLSFCSPMFEPYGDHIVYRHTFKRPRFDTQEVKEIDRTGTTEQKFKSFIFTKSREGYETIPGMSYVGLTKRSWQKRYIEHVEQALNESSSRRFHEAVRTMQGKPVICVHDISGFGMSKEDAKAYESQLIDLSTRWPKGLNMKA